MRLILILLAAFVIPAAASAEECTYTDLHGEFTVSVPCDLMQDFSGHSQDHKRMWLGGKLNQLQIMEAPEPYRTADTGHVISTLGRDFGRFRTPRPIAEATFAGIQGHVVTQGRRQHTSRSWVFNFKGRNLIARLVAFGPRKGRMDRLDEAARLFEGGFKAN